MSFMQPAPDLTTCMYHTGAVARNDHYHSVAIPPQGAAPGERPSPPLVKNRAYRPGRMTQTRRQTPGRGPKHPQN
jgi:hypothetical protein